jgi:hypothetical protein
MAGRKYSLLNAMTEFCSGENKGLAGVIQGLLTIVAQRLRRFGRAVGVSGGEYVNTMRGGRRRSRVATIQAGI